MYFIGDAKRDFIQIPRSLLRGYFLFEIFIIGQFLSGLFPFPALRKEVLEWFLLQTYIFFQII